MKRLLLAIGFIVIAGVFAYAESYDAYIGGGGVIPYGGSNVSATPGIFAGIVGRIGKLLAVGVEIGEDIQYLKNQDSSGSSGSGKPYGTYPRIDIDVNNTTINNYYPKVDPPRQFDRSPRSIFFIEPVVKVGLPIGEYLWPYAKLTYGANRVTSHDGDDRWGHGFSYGAGIQLGFDGGYFVQVEAANHHIDTSNGAYQSIRAMLSGGVRF